MAAAKGLGSTAGSNLQTPWRTGDAAPGSPNARSSGSDTEGEVINAIGVFGFAGLVVVLSFGFLIMLGGFPTAPP